MANHTFTSDIIADALFRAGEVTNANSDFYNQAFVYLNSVYSQVCRGGSELAPAINEDWHWLRKELPGTIILRPALTGTCTVTQDSTSVTLDAAEATSLTDYWFRVDSHPDLFRVATHTAATTAVTLDSVYTGESASSAAYTAFALEYDLATDVLRLTQPMRSYVQEGQGTWGRYDIQRCAPDQLDLWSIANGMTGVPDLFAEVGSSTAGTRRVRFNRYLSSAADTYVRVEYEYLYRPDALTSPGLSEEPALPSQWRHVLSDYLLAYLLEQKNDDRAAGAARLAQAGLLGMAKENRYQMTTASNSQLRIKARPGQLGRWPLRHASWGHY